MIADRQRTICAYVGKLADRLAEMTRADIDTLTAVDLTREEVWGVIELASNYSFTKRMALGTGMKPNREYHFLAR